MSMPHTISIRAKISIAILFLITGVSLFIYLYFPPRLREEATNAIVEKGESIASMTAYTLVPAIAFDDPTAIREIFETAKQNRDLLYLVVCNDSGRVLSGYNVEKADAVNYTQHSEIAASQSTVYKTSSSIVVGKQSIGTLYIGLSLEGLQQRVAESERTVAVVSLFVFLFGLLLAFAVSTILTKPLRQVLEAVEQISKGNLSKRADVSSRDEVGAMATSFNRMVDTLVMTQNQLEEVNRSLEERVRHRTSELQAQIDEHERTKKLLQRREMIISAVSSVTEQFLRSEQWETNIGSALEVLGKSANVSRAYVFKTIAKQGVSHLSLLHEWCADGIVTRIGNPALSRFEFRSTMLYRIEKMLSEGKTVQGTFSALPAKAVQSFRDHGVVSIISAPIFVAKGWWGVIGFDECLTEKEWMPAEMDALTTVARNLGSAIEREIALSALSVSEERYRKFFDNDLTGDFIALGDGTIVDCNPAFAHMFGFDSAARALETNLRDLFPSESQFQELKALLTNRKILTYFELSLKRTDNNPVHVVANLIPYLNEHGTVEEMRGYLFDDTPRKELEQQLMHAQKMESIGTLAGGIAHDFNNILAIISGHVTLLSGSEPSKETLAKSLQTIEKSTGRGVNLVRQLLAFARKTTTRMEPVDINDIVNETVKLLGQTFPKSITIIREQQNVLPNLLADATQINQVLLNLCVNARDAMSQPGTIKIGTRMAEYEKLRRRFPKVHTVPYIELSVTDTGAGMSNEILDKIFEPFFTTKELGKGTGLGLAVVFGIIGNHRGFIDVESEPGKGTTFHIYFPVQEIEEETERVEEGVAAESLEGSGTVLFAEDEEELRQLIELEIASRGYTVFVAADGEEALALYERHASDIDLVLSDMGMPKLDGEHLFYRLKEKNPGLKMIIASGFLGPDVIARLEKSGITALIDKPYETTLLLRKIKEVLH